MKSKDIPLDEVKIFIKAGDGGNGAVSFRREKYVPKGGPDGGDGGRGADVIFVSSKHYKTLNDFRYKRIYRAKNGQPGKGSNMFGKSGEGLIIKVPCGTIIKDFDTGELIADLISPGQEVTVAKGGKGGLGNVNFATSTRQKPYRATDGKAGEEKNLWLELKIIAEVGIIGLPNAGKSLLLSKLTKAKPKVASYPFTTLNPNLGVAEHKGETVIVADLPGLIEGAHEGKGLGDKFLKHVERTRILVHVLDGNEEDIKNNFNIINNELASFSKKLLKESQILAVNKVDLWYKKEETKRIVNGLFEGKKIFFISALTGYGLKDLMDEILKILSLAPVTCDSSDETQETE